MPEDVKSARAELDTVWVVPDGRRVVAIQAGEGDAAGSGRQAFGWSMRVSR